MRVTGINIRRFGVWEQLSLPVPARGLNVFYGPNEAGKTTLFRFIRSLLYGFEPFDVELCDGVSRPIGWEGALTVDSQGRAYEVRRICDRGTRGLVSVIGTDRQAPAEALLADLLHHTDRELFENVFAVGLSELQELATLEGDEVARQIYGLTLGPTGRKLLDAAALGDSARQRWFDRQTHAGRLSDLLEQEQALRDEVASRASHLHEHAELCHERARIEERIEGLKRKRLDCEQQLAGHHFLAHVWPHWNRSQECHAQLESIPKISDFPSDALAQVRTLETEIESRKRARKDFLESMRALRGKLRGFAGQRAAFRHAAILSPLIEEAGWYRGLSAEAAAKQSTADGLKAELDRSLAALGPDWTVSRLESVAADPAADRRMRTAADHYRTAMRRRKRLGRLQKRLSRAVRKRSAKLDERLKSLGGVSLDKAIGEQNKRLEQLHEIGVLRLRESELVRAQNRLTAHLPPDAADAEIPTWMTSFLGVLLIAGLLVTLIGVWQTAVIDTLAGASLAFIGLSGIGIVFGFKRHADTRRQATAGWDEQLGNVERDLRETRTALARLTGSPIRATNPGATPTPADDSVDGQGSQEADDTELLKTAIARLAELQQWNHARSVIQSRRPRLSELRSRFQAAQRDVSERRQDWCLFLRQLGLAETVKIREALQAWQEVAEARERLRAWKLAVDESSQLARMMKTFRARIEDVARRAGKAPRAEQQPLDVLADWETELKSVNIARDEYRRTRRELRDCRQKARHMQRHLIRLLSRRSAFFVKCGAADRREFYERAAWLEQRKECEAQLASAMVELQAAAADQPELAIVEEDLERYDAARNQERIDALVAELEHAEPDLHAGLEVLGRVKQSIATRESDHESQRLRFEQAQTREQLKRAAEEWIGAELARQAVDRMRANFERTCQPAVLALASRYLQRLTGGRYVNVWTPLGQRELRIDDDRGRTLSVEQLSGGTREQLFLAVRLATVRELAQKGVELPMILDDVLVNFDQLRTEAAVETLREFGEENQQILFFTCHLHLAHMFESRGIEPTWLPGHQLPQQDRRAG